MLWQLPVGFALAAVIGYLGYRRGALSKSGVVGAILTGGVIFGFGGLSGAALLLAFFISSSLLSRFKESQKEKLAEKFSKGSQRDLWQALANGGVAALCIGLYALTDQPAGWAAAAAALAAANADTWATELGVLSLSPPRLITNGRVVEVGTSGGVSLTGTAAAFAGSLLIALTALLAVLFDPNLQSLISSLWFLIPLITLAGLLASLFDSLLGATAQAIYFCDSCRKETERYPAHRCGSPTRQIRGWRWLNNDWVNFLATAVGAGLMSFVIFFL
ncbi:MAG TPA: DUF92 domain-containing protein [Anaerolineales bacterium]|nr:DUF92 domain-containing protein [Anaerolineales bacterium]